MAESQGILPETTPPTPVAAPPTTETPPAAAPPADPGALTPEARERILAHLGKKTAPPANDNAKAAATETAKPTEPPAAPAAEEDIDPAAAVLGMVKQARKLQEDRKAAARARADAEAAAAKARADAEAGTAKWKPIEEAISRGDRLAAVKALFGDDKATNELFWDLVNNINGTPTAPAKTEMTPELAAKISEEKAAEVFARRQREEQEKAAAAQAQSLESAKETYVGAVAAEFEAAKDQFRAVKVYGVTAQQIQAYAEECWAKTHTVPDARAVLKHFDDMYTAKARLLNPQAAAVAAKPPVTTLTSELSRDAGGVPSEPPKKLTPADRLELLKAKLRQARH